MILLDIGTLNILCVSDRELVFCVNASLGHLQYTCGHEGYEEKPFNILRFTYLNLKKDCKSLMGFIFFRSRLVYTSITSYGYIMCQTQFTLSNKYCITSRYRILIMTMQATRWRMKQRACIHGATNTNKMLIWLQICNVAQAPHNPSQTYDTSFLTKYTWNKWSPFSHIKVHGKICGYVRALPL